MPEQTNREKEIFSEALEMGSPEARLAYVRGACGADHELRERVEALLKAYESASGFIPNRAGLAEEIPTVVVPVQPTEGPGTVIDRYKLLEKIGEGGFGAVYVAEQREPVKRRVALKIIKLGMDTGQVVARFEAERQALALMDHPNIAKVLDAGATEAGRPYFVMELVRGIPITHYCDENHLSADERLKLFILVCQAIQHAHQKGIIHRDIKPSNILLTVNDGVPVPKVIDFGIAKATQGELTDKTIYTQFQQFIGTPAYMSPEQADMTSLDIDTRSDIYALGVLLYELLVGKTPFDGKELLMSGLDEMRRTIREKEPLRPSTRLRQELLAATANESQQVGKSESEKVGNTAGAESHSPAYPPAHFRSTSRREPQELQRLIPLLRGDLDWIVMKCLEKDRTRRYETANGLSADIKRFLTNEPVMARPPSTAYRFQKAFRRHKLAFTSVAAVGVVLVGGVMVSTWQAFEASKARDAEKKQRLAAQTERDKAQTAQKEAERAQEAEKQERLRAAAERCWEDARSHAKYGRWREAVPFYQKAIELIPTNQEFYHHLAPLLAQVGDLPAYRAHCQAEVARFAQTTELRVAERLAKDCLLLPDSGANLEIILQVAGLAVTAGQNHVDLPWFLMAKGLAEHRANKAEAALTTLRSALEKSLALPASDPGKIYIETHTRAALALAYHRLGRVREAQVELSQAAKNVQTRLPPLTVGGLNDYWPDWIYAHILVREAKALMEGSRQPSDVAE